MSIKFMTRALDESQLERSEEVLTLVALGDNADEYGIAWPGMDTLARRSRCTRKTAGERVKKMARIHEVAVFPNPGASHDYIILLGQSASQIKAAYKRLAQKRKCSTRELIRVRKGYAPTCVAQTTQQVSSQVTQGVSSQTTHEPSGNHQEPSAPKGGTGSNGKPAEVHEDDLTQTDDLFYAIACEIFDFKTKTELATAPSTRSRVNAVVKAFRADHPTATGSDIRAFKQAWQAKEGSPDLPKGEQTLPDNYRTWQKEQAAAPAPSGPRTISLVEEGETV